MDRTANAYIEMIPQFTDADKAFVRQRFAIAREQGMDTTTGKEVDSFFKRQKDIVEAYIDEKGYDYKKSREAWIAKTTAAAAAAKAAKAAKSDAKK
jgi:predicted DsbA family dithiol-disulfide isomerase